MRVIESLLPAAILLVATTLPASAQAVLVVRSNDPGAIVLVDSVRVGRAVEGPFGVEAGRRVVRVVPGLVGQWGLVPVERVLDVSDGDTVTVHGHFEPPKAVEREGRTMHGGVVALDPIPRRRWIDAAAVTTALVAGAVAVHFKRKADARYDIYRVTGDPTLRPVIRDYDTKSGVAAGVMQAGVTVFAVRLLRR